MWEKLGGIATIVVAVTVLYLISVFRPPTFVQIICALAGSIICLIGVVFLFAEGQILTKDRRVKKAPKVG
jgi:archaellum biogenesis protein FlaJ (TadC family)